MLTARKAAGTGSGGSRTPRPRGNDTRMTTVRLTVHGEPCSADVPGRTQLAEMLRDHLHLTGTHLGCEHGVCGACTVLVNGKPIRSCITYAHACEGANVVTVEGLGDDPTGRALREAFARHHAPAMRILHTRNADHGVGHRHPPRADERGGHPARAERQPLPVHRLHGDRGGGAGRGTATSWRSAGLHRRPRRPRKPPPTSPSNPSRSTRSI